MPNETGKLTIKIVKTNKERRFNDEDLHSRQDNG